MTAQRVLCCTVNLEACFVIWQVTRFDGEIGTVDAGGARTPCIRDLSVPDQSTEMLA
jgi:hypothetical protein